MMKIIFFMHGLVGGGAERVTSIIASGLADRGYDVTIMCRDVPSVYSVSEKIRFLHFRNAKRLQLRKYHIEDMRRVMKKEKPDVAIGVLGWYSIYLRIASLGLPVKVVAWDHSSFSFNKFRGFMTYVTKYWIYPLMTRTFVLTRKDYEAAHFKRNIVIMPNPTTFTPLLQPIQKENIVIGIGTVFIWYTKGFDLLLRAWADLQPRHKDWKLVIAGRGTPTYLEKLKSELELEDSVIIKPFDGDIINLYQKASIFVLSSRTEGFSMVLLEAMSQRCACVACDNKGRTEEIAGNESVEIYETGNVEHMSKKIEMLMEDEQLRNELGAKAARKSGEYSKDRILDKWEQALSEIALKKHKSER